MSSCTAQAAEAASTNNNQAAVPRKRRRRTTTTGATEDCFTCRKRQLRCDRRRPYCTQCLEIGKECSGYRTTLTWGVGVASRGKLRGLSLPIVNSTRRACDDNAAANAQPTPKARTLSMPKILEPDVKIKTEETGYTGFSHGTEIHHAGYEYTPYSHTAPIPIAMPSSSPPHSGWPMTGFHEHMEGYGSLGDKPARVQTRPRPLQRVHTLPTNYEESLFSAPSTGSVSTFSESDFPSPSELPPTPEEGSVAEPMLHPFSDSLSFQQDPIQQYDVYAYANASPQTVPVHEYLSSSLGSDFSSAACVETYSTTPPVTLSSFSDFLCRTDMSTPPSEPIQITYAPRLEPDFFLNGMPEHFPDYAQPAWSHTVQRPVDPCGFNHMAPRMKYLLDYYDKAICPVLVAFDGPSNPYRMHIMRLAGSSNALQNAIAALATNNIRMRNMKGLDRLDPFDRLTADGIRDMHSEATPEEIHYKTNAVALFNASLKDPASAADDSVLATLLILCLFHVCDSGFNKFKTQLAGVQKLLAMRDRRNGTSPFVTWIEMFFTWFDVMTATVNDRETLVRGEALDLLDLSANLGALEHLAGCDGRLFKLIARLGRLNLHSHTRRASEAMLPPSRIPTPRASPGAPVAKDYYSLDSNGWGSVLLGPSPAVGLGFQQPSRQDFWTEWHHIRMRLTAWAMDAPPYGPMSPPMADGDSASVVHISEAFRHAALLYTERLAAPHAPPASGVIQGLVTAALRHIAAIPVASCVNKFLLWPVLVVGTECVHGAHRDIIRSRCLEIARECSFFNSLTVLEVLERVWAEDDAGEAWEFVKVSDSCASVPMLSSLGGQAFRWRRAMCRAEGEYIVV
ncbi:hypothetical protein EJ06DRAFT_422051 [Trichodelitschia bisporula]|uniref:Zn(2)-C6 fungal-type domain-containing protein n=1 Tax=Trichodelitschia bisporula TaxID=703511 RepID=A0A6G1HVZ8_9PEZI|nr:hypothetical protein EJ06DRAFT_422051 [Trichodelitschia bisporula]